MSAEVPATRGSDSRPTGYVDTAYLQLMAEFVGRVKRRTYDLMRAQAGQAVLDVGCGPGIDTVALADLVGPAGRVVGIDHDPDMVAEANRRAEDAGVLGWTSHVTADVASLPFESDHFDSCRSERLFQHLSNPAAALSEMVRVTKPGGWIVVLDTDLGSLSIDTEEVDIERRIVRFAADRLRNGYSGRTLYRLFRRAHLLDITPEPVPLYSTDYAFSRRSLLLDDAEREALAAGIVTSEELARWHASLEEADREGVLFGAALQMIMVGRKAGAQETHQEIQSSTRE